MPYRSKPDFPLKLKISGGVESKGKPGHGHKAGALTRSFKQRLELGALQLVDVHTGSRGQAAVVAHEHVEVFRFFTLCMNRSTTRDQHRHPVGDRLKMSTTRDQHRHPVGDRLKMSTTRDQHRHPVGERVNNKN
ncbi:hypothetical protein EYF80_048950 [Liparis tanakae]|uniref:Uncharacterized protein n=1 Tax=Liparis tanakae TaxID=230148 RepID=A0A4Z2FKR1_9TELE|nr:hypothetical protein EYF80_048950 [Liparis tanakae]